MPKQESDNQPNKFTKTMSERNKIRKPSTGLGDTIEKITEATGIKKLVKFVAGEDCGCEERKQRLNKLFRYQQPLCLLESEYGYLTEFYLNNPEQLTKEQANEIVAIWNRVFQTRKFYRPCTCNPREWVKLIDDLKVIYQEYEQ
jgi:hypothetical protein